MSLTGKTALVTGAARGQGRAHAVALAQRGANVLLLDRCQDLESVAYPLASSADLDDTRREIEAAGGRCLAFEVDVRDTSGLDEVVRAGAAEYGGIDICVANAGICGFGRVHELTDLQWEEMIGVDLTGVFKTLRAVTPGMIDRGWGRVVVTSSMGGRMGTRNLAHYVAAKWGVIGLVKTLALEVAEQGITVNAICPATVDTPMVHNDAFYRLFTPDVERPTRDDVRPRHTASNPMRVPWLDTSDITNALLYLVSDEARYVSGSTLDVSLATAAGMP
ncbi:mycofactocin-coupled SDR family oxidoreductase [Nocardioides sp. YIM 152315]|uniref:mycofactocin-coupled SDR family oxidoreductase n=1 Tax=Nocardioides sp. YIM 152315 TaxID=3031760 RepID=UPI0023DB925D|nr:mycofactocin-coupled SDR family oxidoreductase [Nocardioides sp. YIM 152315]MDF1604684.1 mycofactocin-coupled SDR family oxidoreductase [Nocardioides sp. YIM 152315]